MAAEMLLTMVATLGLVQAPDPGIGKWIRDLGHDDVGIREEAAKRLRKSGDRALASLDKAATSPDAEVAGRARAVAARIRRDIRIREVCPPPRRVSIRAKGLTLAGAARLVSEQSGYRLNVGRRAAGVAIDELALDDVPFWEAVAKLAEGLPPAGKRDVLFPVYSDRDGASLSIGGPCRYATDSALLVALSARKSKRLDLACFVEPGNKEAFAVRGELLDLRDGKGDAIPVRSRGAKWELPWRWQYFAFDLRAPLPPRLSRVRVRFAVHHALGWREVQIAPAREVRKVRAREWEVTHQIRYHEGLQFLEVKASFERPLPRGIGPILLRNVRAEDSLAKKVGVVATIPHDPIGDRTVTCRYRLKDPSGSSLLKFGRVTLRLPADFVAREHEFTFKDVELLDP